MGRETRQQIINAYFRLALKSPEQSEFSLTEIAKEAQISRQAIYQKHYQNVQEIKEDLSSQLLSHMEKVFGEQKNQAHHMFLENFAEHVLPLLYQYRQDLRAFYTTSLSAHWQNKSETFFQKWLRPYLKNKYKNKRLNINKMVFAMSKMLSALIATWLTEDFPLPASCFKQTFLNLLTNFSETAVKESFFRHPKIA